MGYIHRDIKPDNIMLQHKNNGQGADLNFKICDFGLAIKEDTKEFLYKRCGTPGFVPPEIILSGPSNYEKSITRKWDTFSIGSILYMLISRIH